jgi:hypothetical protein
MADFAESDRLERIIRSWVEAENIASTEFD